MENIKEPNTAYKEMIQNNQLVVFSTNPYSHVFVYRGQNSWKHALKTTVNNCNLVTKYHYFLTSAVERFVVIYLSAPCRTSTERAIPAPGAPGSPRSRLPALPAPGAPRSPRSPLPALPAPRAPRPRRSPLPGPALCNASVRRSCSARGRGQGVGNEQRRPRGQRRAGTGRGARAGLMRRASGGTAGGPGEGGGLAAAGRDHRAGKDGSMRRAGSGWARVRKVRCGCQCRWDQA